MKVFVAASDLWAARHAAGVLRDHGHSVVSTWHDGDPGPPGFRRDAAARNVAEAQAADAVVLLATHEKVAGAKFVEAGVALGLSRPVVCVGRRENMDMHHPGVWEVSTPAEAAAALLEPLARGLFRPAGVPRGG